MILITESTRSIKYHVYSIEFIRLVIMIFILLLSVSQITLKAQSTLNTSNIEIMRTLIDKLTDSIIAKTNYHQSENIYLHLPNHQNFWLIEETISSKLKEKDFRVFKLSNDSLSSGILLKINDAELKVTYGDVYREGLFGKKKTIRNVFARINVQSLNLSTNEILLSEILKSQLSDTVNVSDIPNLETPTAPFTHAEISGDTLIDRLIEPFIIIGATGAVVYLFFYIRSK